MKQYKDTILFIAFLILILVWGIVRIKPIVTDFVHTKVEIWTKTAEAEELNRTLTELKTVSMREEAQESSVVKKIYKSEEGIDSEASFATILDDIVEFARINGIRTKSVEYVYNPADDAFVKGASDKYNVCQINMELITNYQDFQSFLKDLYKYPYLLGISSIELMPYVKNNKILLIGLKINIYTTK